MLRLSRWIMQFFKSIRRSKFVCLLLLQAISSSTSAQAADDRGLKLAWVKEMLTISGPDVPGKRVEIHYLEAFCKPGSTDRDWGQTVIPHTTKLVEASKDGKRILLRHTLKDGVIAESEIIARLDEVEFRVTATNPTDKPSLAHWAQPCVRVDAFTGFKPVHSSEDYLPKGFIFVDGKLSRMPVQPWATKARYTPGQVWCPLHVDRNDVNPRPLSTLVPSNGLIGCFSADESKILASAWEPYQELFQGVIVCLHSDFRIAGLAPGETKKIKGKLYIIDADLKNLLKRYQADFPEHEAKPKP